MVLDLPTLDLTAESPTSINYGLPISLKLKVQKTSFNPPKNIILTLRGLGTEQRWELPELNQDLVVDVNLDKTKLAFSNKLTLQVTWSEGSNDRNLEKEITFSGKGQGITENI
ncbi:hypothetical protein HYU21_02095, partial [Candidatus Woesearchaeota archaeon]|nr:hypothetical protein [Candidatus Woesearchaeota archaeon]